MVVKNSSRDANIRDPRTARISTSGHGVLRGRLSLACRSVRLRPTYANILARLGGAILSLALMIAALAILSTGTAQPAAAQTTVEPGCGYWNGPPCTPVDNEYWNIYFSAPSPCDFGLIWDPASLFDPNLSQTCNNASRMTMTQDSGWLGWAMNEQRYNIQWYAPINLVTTLGTHNSYSSYGDGFQSSLTVDQRLSIWDQLQAGARYIRLDPDYYYNNMRLCHGSSTLLCELGSPPTGPVAGSALLSAGFAALGPLVADIGVITPGRLYAYAVLEIAQWMNANPQEFIILDVHMGESACGDAVQLASGSTICSHDDLIYNPIRDYIGTTRIFTPQDYQGSVMQKAGLMPTMHQLIKANKRMLIVSSDPITDENGKLVAFDRSSSYTETESKNLGTWPVCRDDNGNGLWQGGETKFAYASEDRTASVTLLDPSANYGYLNAEQVAQAANCGYGIIALDFLLYQGLSQLPLPNTVPFDPDGGPDHRREASIWSYDEGDTGTNGPAIMKPNGRWSSDVTTAKHPFACTKGADYFHSQWVISDVQGGYYDYMKGSVCPDGYGFSTPITGVENTTLHSLGIPPGGVWLKYIGSAANLLSGASPASLAFAVDAGSSSAPSQQITVNGPPNVTVSVNALSQGVTTLSVPSSITFDGNGSATFNVSLLSSVSKLGAGFYGSTVFINAPIQNTGSSAGNLDLTISHVSVSVMLKVRGPDTVTFLVSRKGISVSEVLEGTPIHIYGQVSNALDSVNPPTGTITLKGVEFEPGNPNPTTKQFAQLPLQLDGIQTGFSYAGTDIVLPPGKYQMGARYPGDVFHLPAASPVIDFTVTPWFNVSPQSYQLTFPQGRPGVAPQPILVNNNANITAAVTCAGQLTGCWLQSSVESAGSQQKAALAYTSFAAQLSPGTYNATVTIRDGVHTSVVVQVALVVTGRMVLTPSNLTFVAAAGLQGEAQEVTGAVQNTSVALTARASSVDWLKFQNDQVMVTSYGLPSPGTYVEWIDFQETQNGAGSVISTNVVRLPVTVQVVPLSTVSTSPSETVTVDGVDYLSPAQFAWVPGSTHSLNVSQIIPGADGGLVFTQWFDLVTTPTRQVTAPANLGDMRSWKAIYAAK